MPRYFFNVLSPSERVIDHEGTDLADIESARMEAVLDARSLMSAAVLKGNDISSRRIEICDEAGRVLMVVPFQDAIRPPDP